MTTADWITSATNQLRTADIATARLDALVLLGDVLHKHKAWLLSHPEHELQRSELENLSTKIDQRAQHIPLAYIRGKVEFYGREFAVNEHTLVPRPETEAIIEMLKRVRNREADMHVFPGEPYKRRLKEKKRYAFQKTEPNSTLVKTAGGYKMVWKKQPRSTAEQLTPETTPRNSLSYHDEDFHLIDIGTGSGAIAITAKLEMPEASVTAIDIDELCLALAKQNARNLAADIMLLQGNLLEPLQTSESDKCPILLCNLPYVPDDFHINTAATHEPRHALFGGKDGLDLYRELFNQIQSFSWRPAYIITESLPPQHSSLAALAKAAGFVLQKTDDFIQLFENVDQL